MLRRFKSRKVKRNPHSRSGLSRAVCHSEPEFFY
jgi:hypothetical protein